MSYSKSFITLVVAVLLSLSLTASAVENSPQLETKDQKLGYALGMDIGISLKAMSRNLDIKTLTQGIKDIYTSQKPLLNYAEATRIRNKFSTARHQEEASKKRSNDLKNMQLNLDFLEKNKLKKNIQVTSSGLQYEILRKGKGTPGVTKMLRIKYRGYLINGEEFFNNIDSKKPVKIEVKKQIKGLQEGLALMPSGSKYRFYIHPRLAYGGLGHGRHIKPYDVLIFEVERLQ